MRVKKLKKKLDEQIQVSNPRAFIGVEGRSYEIASFVLVYGGLHIVAGKEVHPEEIDDEYALPM